MAILKTIQIHDTSGITAVEKYIENPEKTDAGVTGYDITRELEYDANGIKTTIPGTSERLVSGYLCNPENAAVEFSYPRKLYEDTHQTNRPPQGKKRVIAVHLVQSFPEMDKLDPRLVHHIGEELVERINKAGLGQYQAVISTHMNTRHIHNHILMNAFSVDGKQKFRGNLTVLKQIRDINDGLSKEYGLPTLEENRPLEHNESIAERSARMAGRSWKEQMRQDIDAVIETSSSYREWKEQINALGYEVRELADGTPVSIADGTKHIRLSRLGADYTYSSVIERIAENNGISERDQEPSVPHVKLDRVKRYSEDGRRRGSLEMLFLQIIAYIKNVVRTMQAFGQTEQANALEDKVKDLDRCLELLSEYNLSSKSDLRSAMKESGYRQYSLKQTIDMAEKAISAYQNAKDLPDKLSDLDPMTPQQKRSLYSAFQDTGYHCHVKFSDISSYEADQILGYLKAAPRPKDAPAVLTSGPQKPTPEILQAAQRHAEKRLKASQKMLEEEDRKYKDLIYLKKNMQESEDMQEELKNGWEENDRITVQGNIVHIDTTGLLPQDAADLLHLQDSINALYKRPSAPDVDRAVRQTQQTITDRLQKAEERAKERNR